MKVIKVDDSIQEFCLDKILTAVKKANAAVNDDSAKMNDEQIQKVLNTVMKKLEGYTSVSVNDIHDFVEQSLVRHNRWLVSREYIKYREQKKKGKKFTPSEEKFISILNGTSELRGDNANKHIDDNGSIRDYGAGLLCKSIALKTLPKDIINAHNKGLIHYHDMDYSPVQPEHNCGLGNVEDLLTNGFAMGNTGIFTNEETPFRTVCNLIAQANLIVSGRQYGGQTVSWSHALPFIDLTRNLLRNKLTDFCTRRNVTLSKEEFDEEVESMLLDEIKEGVKTYQYQILCHQSSNGQTPFVSNNLCLREAETEQELKDFAVLIREIFNRRIKGVQDALGHYVTPLFPKLLYWTCDGLNVKKEDPYFSLTELAALCEIKRTQPDICSERETRKLKNGQIIPSMGCRSLLHPIWEDVKYDINTEFYFVEGVGTYPYGTFVDKKSFKDFENRTYKTGYEHGEVSINFRGNTGWLKEKTDEYVIIEKPIVYGRFNQGVVTINIPHVALEALEVYKDNPEKSLMDIFYNIFDERLELCHKALLTRHESVSGIKSINSEFLWRYGFYSRLSADKTVGDLMKEHPLSASISLGYVGLFETCRALINESNTSENGIKLSKEILQYMNDKCQDWKFTGHKEDNDTINVYTSEDLDVEELINKVKENGRIVNNKLFTLDTINVKDKYLWFIDLTDNSVMCVNTPVEHLAYSIYGTPEENLTKKVADANKRDFGVIPYITDKDYVVNSYHVDPREHIDAFTKLKIEGEYLALSPGGAVSYVETLDLIKNPAVIIDIIQWMHENIVYAEFNRKIGVCYECGYEGDIDLVKTENGEFKFICPHCGNTDDSKMDVTARICGYLGKVNAENVNTGRLDDIYNRTIHLDCEDVKAY